MWQIRHRNDGDLPCWELSKWMASNAQVEVVTLIAVKPRTNYKTLTLVALVPDQVNIEYTITPGKLHWCRQVYIIRNYDVFLHTSSINERVAAEVLLTFDRTLRLRNCS